MLCFANTSDVLLGGGIPALAKSSVLAIDSTRHVAFAFPFQSIWREVLIDEVAAVLLPYSVRLVVVGRRDPAQPWRLAERHDPCCGHGTMAIHSNNVVARALMR